MIQMPIPHTPLYVGLANFVAHLLGSVAESQPDDITDRATRLEGKAGELRSLVEECRAALQAGFGMDTWTGSAADSGRGLIETLLDQLAQRAQKAEEEAESLRTIANLLKAAQDYYTQQATVAEQIIGRLMANPFSRPLAQLMAVFMGYQLASILGRFRAAITSVGTDSLTPLWNDADQVAGRPYGIDYTPTS